MILLIIIIFFMLLLISHYKKYINFEENYQIDQQELDDIDGQKLYDNKYPLIITFIENNTLNFNVEEYKLFSSLSIDKKYFSINENDRYYSHNFEILLIKSPLDITVEIINPKYKSFFQIMSNNNHNQLTSYNLDENNYNEVKSVDIITHEYNILYIPRFWIFKIESENVKGIEFYSTHNIFSKIFSYVN